MFNIISVDADGTAVLVSRDKKVFYLLAIGDKFESDNKIPITNTATGDTEYGYMRFIINTVNKYDDTIEFNMWVRPSHEIIDEDIDNARYRVANHLFKITRGEYYCKTTSEFFSLLDRLGENWGKFGITESAAGSFIKLHGLVGDTKEKKVIASDFFHKKRNLKGMVVTPLPLVVKGSNKSGEKYLFCRFQEDIDGSCMDGLSDKKDCLFLPQNIIQTEKINKENENGSKS